MTVFDTDKYWIVQQPESIAVCNGANSAQRIAPIPECGKPDCACVGMRLVGQVQIEDTELAPVYECNNGEWTAIQFVATPQNGEGE